MKLTRDELDTIESELNARSFRIQNNGGSEPTLLKSLRKKICDARMSDNAVISPETIQQLCEHGATVVFSKQDDEEYPYVAVVTFPDGYTVTAKSKNPSALKDNLGYGTVGCSVGSQERSLHQQHSLNELVLWMRVATECKDDQMSLVIANRAMCSYIRSIGHGYVVDQCDARLNR